MTDSPLASQITRGMDCPHCGYPLPGDARVCPHCQVDLALFALLAERASLEGFPQSSTFRPPPAALVPRIGEYLIEQGLLAQDKLEVALRRQQQQAERGQQRLLGQTLIELGMIDRETLDRAITRQIIELHAALQETNRTLERRVIERTAELRRALERLTELNQIKANLISNVSHELRTPLAHIKGYVELLSQAQLGALTPEQDHAVGVIQRAGDRLERLIEDLIAFSTASREGLSLNLTRVDVAGLAQEVAGRAAEKAAKAGVEVRLDFQNGLPPVEADREKIGWVLYQLVDNGIKFSPATGEIVMTASQEGRLVRLAVRDSGIGIPPERVMEIFEPFHQLDGSPTRRYGGTGLGLALVKLVLASHSTEMHVRSSEGMGSEFSFLLPGMIGET
jgi:signal transduction histidine kinase